MIFVRIGDGVAEVSAHAVDNPTVPPTARPTAPFATALVEARGALLRWDVTANKRFPDADITDAATADAWLIDVYGAQIAAAVRAVGPAPVTVPLPESADLVDATHALAVLGWARAWWPAGSRVPALDPALLAAEIAIASSIVEHLLDDNEAVERALADARTAPAALAALPDALAAEADAMREALADLAETYGVELDAVEAAAPARQTEWALAAGGSTESATGIEVASGSAQVRWGDVPAQTVAADADARWMLRQVAGVAMLHAVAPAAPGIDLSGAEPLLARFGPADLGIDVVLEASGTEFAGATAVTASALFLPADERMLWVRDPRMGTAAGEAESVEARERVLAFASRRLTWAEASLSERAAGARR